MIPDSGRLAGILGAALVEAIDRAVDARLQQSPARTTPTPEGFIGVAEAARRAGVRPAAVRTWIVKGLLRAGRPPGFRDWRIKPTDLEALLSESRGATPVPIDLSKKRAARSDALAAAVKGENHR